MPDTLIVDLNDPDRNDVRVADSLSVTGPFVVRIRNHGRDAHPHLKLDDDLARVATLGESNPYVAGDDAVDVTVDVAPGSGPVAGRMKIESGYGAEATYVDVSVRPPDDTPAAAVDDGRSTTDDDEDDGEGTGDGGLGVGVGIAPEGDAGVVLVAVVAVVAVAVAAGAWTLVGNAVVAGGIAVVLLGVGAALFILLR